MDYVINKLISSSLANFLKRSIVPNDWHATKFNFFHLVDNVNVRFAKISRVRFFLRRQVEWSSHYVTIFKSGILRTSRKSLDIYQSFSHLSWSVKVLSLRRKISDASNWPAELNRWFTFLWKFESSKSFMDVLLCIEISFRIKYQSKSKIFV